MRRVYQMDESELVERIINASVWARKEYNRDMYYHDMKKVITAAIAARQ